VSKGYAAGVVPVLATIIVDEIAPCSIKWVAQGPPGGSIIISALCYAADVSSRGAATKPKFLVSFPLSALRIMSAF